MKKSLSVILGIFMIFIMGQIAFAEENYIDETAIFVNPCYKDVVTEEEIAALEVYEVPSFFAVDDYCETVEEAGASFREQFEAREEAAVVKIRVGSEVNDYDLLLSEIFNSAVEHTGKPTQGDYLLWQSSGAKAKVRGTSYADHKDLTLTITVAYYTTAEQEAVLDAEIETLLDSLDLDGKSQYEKVCAIYDYICDNITYDYENLNNDSYNLKHTAYAALINKTAVCQGYANLFYRLALEEGIDTRLIPGIVSGRAHGWNIVRLAGKYYNLDSTWDAGNINNFYFLCSNEDFSDHIRDEEYNTAEFNSEYPMSTSSYGFSGEENVLAGGWCGTEGYQGKNLEWSFDANGVLTISGSGEMKDYVRISTSAGVGTDAPWFEYCEDIRKIVILDGVKSVGNSAFAFLWRANNMPVIPSSVERIGEEAFRENNIMVETLVIPEGVKVIENLAFSANAFYHIVIPASVEEIGKNRTFGFEFKSISVSEDNQNYCAIDGVLFSKDKKNLIMAPKSVNGKYVVPDGTENIEGSAFYYCDYSSVIIPESVKAIEENVFAVFDGAVIIYGNPSLGKSGFGYGAFVAENGFEISVYFMNGEPSTVYGKYIFDNRRGGKIDVYYLKGTENKWTFDEDGLWNGYEVKLYSKYGDINCDFVIDVKDVLLARIFSARLLSPTAEQKQSADVDGDGKITAIDANYIRRYSAKVINSFPAEG